MRVEIARPAASSDAWVMREPLDSFERAPDSLMGIQVETANRGVGSRVGRNDRHELFPAIKRQQPPQRFLPEVAAQGPVGLPTPTTAQSRRRCRGRYRRVAVARCEQEAALGWLPAFAITTGIGWLGWRTSSLVQDSSGRRMISVLRSGSIAKLRSVRRRQWSPTTPDKACRRDVERGTRRAMLKRRAPRTARLADGRRRRHVA